MKRKQSRRRQPQKPCAVCKAPARHAFYGVVVCASCRMFFRRNGNKDELNVQCPTNGHCSINVANRPFCSPCRLAKCFSRGMKAEMLQRWTSRRQKQLKQKSIANDNATSTTPPSPSPGTSPSATTTTAVCPSPPPAPLFLPFPSPVTVLRVTTDDAIDQPMDLDPYEKIPRCDFLHSGQLELSIERIYDILEHMDVSTHLNKSPPITGFLREQAKLPLKLRFKSEYMENLLLSFVATIRHLCENDHRFRSLITADYGAVLDSCLRQVAFLHTVYGLRCSSTTDENVDSSSSMNPSECDPSTLINCSFYKDITFTKLIMMILIFLTNEYIHSSELLLTDMETIVRIEDQYIQLLWQYFIAKYGPQQTVQWFFDLILPLVLPSSH